VHEVKHDGYLIVRRDGEAVRLFTRRGYDWIAIPRILIRTSSLLKSTTY
jgi:ATP-dependent DNA ligase